MLYCKGKSIEVQHSKTLREVFLEGRDVETYSYHYE